MSPQINPETLPALLAALAHDHAGQVALRHKQYGLWNEVSYAAYFERVRETALGLRALGVQAGERVAIICENTPLWLYAQLGVQAAGGVSVGLYPSMTPREVAEVLALTGAQWAIVQGEEQVDKLLEVQAAHPSSEQSSPQPASQQLRRVVYGSARGMRKHGDNPLLLSFEALGQLGNHQPGDTFGALLAQGRADDLAHLTLTSGTTGPVRAVTVTHRQLLGVGQALLEVDPLRPGDDYLSFLPLAWSGEQLMSLSVALQSRLTVNFPESSETVMTDLAELGPQVMYTPARIWEDLRASLLRRMGGSYPLNRVLARGLLRGSEQAAQVRLNGQKAGGGALARTLLTRPMLDRSGLLRLKRAYVTGSALSPELLRFFHALGVNLKAAYGQAESMGLSHVQRDGDVRSGSVGQPLPGAEASLDGHGTLRVRAPWLSSGYHGSPQPGNWLHSDGWFHSGDAAEVGPGGHLSVRGRASELCRTLGGQVVEPQQSENRLKLSPYIRDALVLADGQDAATALLALDAGALGSWAEGQRLAYGTFADLTQRPEVATLIRSEVEAANQELSTHQQVRRFAVLYKPLDADDGELTRTGTVRRSVVISRFSPLVAGLKDGASHARLHAEVEYGDGQRTSQELTVPLHSLGTPAGVQPTPSPVQTRSLA